jgi:hypothetical protein
LDEKRVEKKVEREETVVRKDKPIAGKKITNVNVASDGTTNVQETTEAADEVDEPVKTVTRKDTTIERRESR